ncbi:MAG: hypothetical protein IPM38_11035 [Ignavibacteria bacterium]|nr:hypothetical protein [Ignavibacteria bacterium]
MNRSAVYFLILFSAAFYSSCSDNSQNGNNIEPDNNFKYPYSLNSYWYYKTKNVITNIRPDSIRKYFNTDTVTGYGISTFLKDTVLSDDTVRIFRNEYSFNGHISVTREYFNQADSGLIRKAFLSNGSGLGPYRNNINFFHGGMYYSSVYEILQNAVNDFQGSDSVITFDDPPVKVIRYPMEVNAEWILKQGPFLIIKKRYAGFENINISGNNYYCMKINRLYYFNVSPDENLIYTDYFSKEGIQRRDIYIKDILVMNEFGAQIGNIDLSEITNVTLQSIK